MSDNFATRIFAKCSANPMFFSVIALISLMASLSGQSRRPSSFCIKSCNDADSCDVIYFDAYRYLKKKGMQELVNSSNSVALLKATGTSDVTDLLCL